MTRTLHKYTTPLSKLHNPKMLRIEEFSELANPEGKLNQTTSNNDPMI